MKIKLIVIGKTKESHFQKSEKEYCKRLQRFVKLTYTVLPEIKEHKGITQEQVKQKEADLIKKNLQTGDFIILLDENGKQLRSKKFSNWLQQKEMNGRDLVFIIGGPYGFTKEIYERSDFQLSLSEMTFSHQMVRMFFLEQLYRAYTIKHGLPYHHE